MSSGISRQVTRLVVSRSIGSIALRVVEPAGFSDV